VRVVHQDLEGLPRLHRLHPARHPCKLGDPRGRLLRSDPDLPRCGERSQAVADVELSAKARTHLHAAGDERDAGRPHGDALGAEVGVLAGAEGQCGDPSLQTAALRGVVVDRRAIGRLRSEQ
jgi:hypothetical protein